MASLPEEESSVGSASPHTSSAPSGTLTRMSSFEIHPPPLGPQLGDVLVVGGCGFLGHHVVKFLLKEPTCTSISVMCRSPFKNRLEGVTYLIGDVTNLSHVRHVLSQTRPKTIFNTASPHAYKDHEHVPDIFRVNIDGNQNLLEAAAEIGTVQAYVYTSSGPIVAGSGSGYDHADETYPTIAVPVIRKGDPYHVAKALGDKLVLEANGKHGIRTCCIRPTALYGEGDGQMIGPVIQALENGQTNIWMGYNDIEMDVVYVGHVAIAEILAAKALLAEIDDAKAPKVAGEAFNITDDQPSPPLTFFRKYWALAGDTTPLSSVWYIPPFLVLIMAHVAEWIVWATSMGKKRPESLILERMEFILFTRTYSVKKARERLGFVPWKDQPYASQDQALKASVEWYLLPANHGPVRTGVNPSWPETPFKLIPTTNLHTTPGIPANHYCVTAALHMAQTHNTIFRALNSIYLHSFTVLPNTRAAANLLSYCAIAYDFMHHHQLLEETLYFPSLASASATPNLMQENVRQHAVMDDGIEAFRRYAETTKREEFCGERLRSVMEVFRESYEVHQHEEIGTILELGVGGRVESEVLRGCEREMRKEAERGSDVFKAAPFVLTAQDNTTPSSTLTPSFPPLSFPLNILAPYIISWFLYSRHAGAWGFAPSDVWGRPREMPSASNSPQHNSDTEFTTAGKVDEKIERTWDGGKDGKVTSEEIKMTARIDGELIYAALRGSWHRRYVTLESKAPSSSTMLALGVALVAWAVWGE